MVKQRMHVTSVNSDFFHQWKRNAKILLSESAKRFGTFRRLAAKLVARKTKNGKAPVTIALIEPFQLFELRCKATLACHIDDQQYLAAKRTQVERFAEMGVTILIV